MVKNLLVLVPSKGRPEQFERCTNLLSLLSHKPVDVLGIVDEVDDGEYLGHGRYVLNPSNLNLKNMNSIMNHFAVKYANSYKYIGFLGDDHFCLTEGWDRKVLNAFKKGALIVSGDDLGTFRYKGYKLPTFWFMDTRLIKAMGYMCPPVLYHFYMDNFMVDLGTALNRFFSLDDLVIEHRHYLYGKSEMDPTYQNTNTNTKTEHDRIAYDSYLNTNLLSDIEKCLRAIKS